MTGSVLQDILKVSQFQNIEFRKTCKFNIVLFEIRLVFEVYIQEIDCYASVSFFIN